jgi:hypothetical protein
LFGVSFDDSWGVMGLGEAQERARTWGVDLPGYYGSLLYVRDGSLVAFDAMIDATILRENSMPDTKSLLDSLGPPDEKLDWAWGVLKMSGSEYVYARRGITLFFNPETQAVIYVTLYAPTTVDRYKRTLRPLRKPKEYPQRLRGC